jgi:hypothetical protein
MTPHALHLILFLILTFGTTKGWIFYSTASVLPCLRLKRLCLYSSRNFNSELLEMDIVLFKRKGKSTAELGAVQEDGTIAPLSAWTLEPAYDDMIELVVDEKLRFPGFLPSDAQEIQIIKENFISYGSRQIGGGKGPRNPHGEESELLYYVKQSEISSAFFPINPDLEV